MVKIISNIIAMLDSRGTDISALWAYQNLILTQPHIKTKGLFQREGRYYILCDELNEKTLAMDGTRILDWFDNNKPAHCCVELVDTYPEGTMIVREKKFSDLVIGGSMPKNMRDLYITLSMGLPKDFPDFELVSEEAQTIAIKVERKLDFEEIEKLKTLLSSLSIPVIYKIYVDINVTQKNKNFRYKYGQGDIDIIPSRLITSNVSEQLKNLIEEDEEIWRNKRLSIISGDIKNLSGVMPDKWDRHESRCFINASIFDQINIRNYLSLYEKVIIALPLSGSEKRILSSLMITEDELVELAYIGRVGFVLPQSIDRYPLRLVEKIADACPNSLIFSRKLAAMTIIDTRNRFPFLYPPFGIKERHEVIKVLYSYAYNAPKNISRTILPVIIELGRIWSITEDMLNYRGAMATASLGIASIFASILKEECGLDRYLEFYSSASTVEWASPFGANVTATITDGYSDTNYIQFLANAYSGIGHDEFPVFTKNTKDVLDGILAVDSNLPVIEFASTFKGSDVSRLRDLIFKMSNNIDDVTDIEKIIREFNYAVRNYENRKEKLAEWKISGLANGILSLTSAMLSQKNPQIGIPLAGIPLITWMIEVLNAKRSRNEYIGKALDSIEGLVIGTKPEIVLVARMKRENS